ncbi:hypothetical protein CVS40_3671 [Lucilia cuprina]|nr:hypothetical protein CVS40_3671 [Lucilia cuprina]
MWFCSISNLHHVWVMNTFVDSLALIWADRATSVDVQPGRPSLSPIGWLGEPNNFRYENGEEKLSRIMES